ncbi:MAG TPA: glycosyltransferase family 39 protein [Anaerolineae bacterium]|nr:glycosyltransferase family 39 protein [Anaerolineae bacterium]
MINRNNLWKGIIVIVVVFFLFGNIDGWQNNDDEGTALYAAWRISVNEQPYIDFTTTKAPLFLQLGGTAVKFLGRNLFLLRSFMATLILGSSIFFAWSIKQVWSEQSSWIIWANLLLMPQFYHISRVFRADTLMLAFMLVGLGFLILENKYQKRYLLALSGICFGLGFLAKALGVMPMFGAGLWLLIRMRHHRKWKHGIVDGLILTVAALATTAVGYLLSEWRFPGTIEMVLGVEGSGNSATLLSTVPNCYGNEINWTLCRLTKGSLAWLAIYYNNWPLIFSITPFIMLILYQHKPNPAWIFGTQIIASLPIFFISGPVFARYLIYAIPSLIALWWTSIEQFDMPWFPKTNKPSILIPALLFPLLLGWQTVLLFQSYEQDTSNLANWIAENTPTNAIVLSDYAEIPFHAGRQSIPSQGGIGYGWAVSGLITGAQIQTELEATNAQAIILHIPEDPSEPAHMYNMLDFEEFYQYVQNNYKLQDVRLRTEQRLEVWLKSESP